MHLPQRPNLLVGDLDHGDGILQVPVEPRVCSGCAGGIRASSCGLICHRLRRQRILDMRGKMYSAATVTLWSARMVVQRIGGRVTETCGTSSVRQQHLQRLVCKGRWPVTKAQHRRKPPGRIQTKKPPKPAQTGAGRTT